MHRAIAPLLALIVAVLLVPSVLRSEEILFQRDLLDFFLPMKAAWTRAMADGILPWWDPLTHGGQPFFANLQSQVLYPPNLIFLAGASLAWSLSAFVALHLAWAGWGAYLLARELGASPRASLIALLGMESGGFLVSLVDLLNQACAQAWLPWILLCGCRHARLGSRRELAGWAACCAFAFLAGEPQYAALAGLASVALAWSHARGLLPDAPRLALRRAGIGGLAAALLALLACLVQLIPLAELALGSTRATSAFHGGGRHALDPPRLGALLEAPAHAHGGPAGVLVESLHLGGVIMLLALAGALIRKPVPRMLLLASLVSALLAFGPHLPVVGEGLVAATPFLRYPIKYFCVAATLVPVLAALGAHALAERLSPRKPWTARALLALAPSLAAIELVTAQAVLLPTLPAGPLLATTPLIEHLQARSAPDGPRVHATPVTSERLTRRAGKMRAHDLAGAMRERVELLEGALPLYFGISATWGGTALPPREQAALLQEATGPLTREQVARLQAGWLLDAAPRVLPLEPLEIEGGAARLYRLEGFESPAAPRTWDGPNRVTGRPGDPSPSSWPGWREDPPGTWTFRPTGLLPCGIVSAATWLFLVLAALPIRRSPVAKRQATR